MILIQSPDGNEKCLVNSLRGYDGWTVVYENVCEPEPHCFWCSDKGEWQVDEDARALADLVSVVRDPHRLAALLADILARLPKEAE
jgi:hypothetical protein